MTYYRAQTFDRQHRQICRYTNEVAWKPKCWLLRTQQPRLRPIRETRLLLVRSELDRRWI